jgi:hypothetical protein
MLTVVQWGLYFQTGTFEMMAHLTFIGELAIPALVHHLGVFKAHKMTIIEALQIRVKIRNSRI